MSKPPIECRRPAAYGRARRVVAILGATLLAGLLALPVAAAAGPTRLHDPLVEPRQATPGTSITFAVTYRNREGSPADWVRVRVGDAVHDLHPTTAATDPSDWKAGVRFEAVVRAPAVGTYAVTFISFDSRRFYDRLEASSVTIVAPPSPNPSPTPTPTTVPAPTATPTPQPTPTPRPTKAPLGGGGTASSGSGSSSSGTSDGSTDSAPSGGGSAGGTVPVSPDTAPSPLDPGDGTGGWTGGSVSAPTGGQPGQGPGAWPGAGIWDPAPGSAGDGTAVRPQPSDSGLDPSAPNGEPWAPDPGWPTNPSSAIGGARPASVGAAGRGLLDALGVGPRIPDEVWVASVFVTSAGGAAMAMACLLFGRRRRQDDERPTAEASATSGVTIPPSSVLVPDPDVPEAERHLPRWRRPSLLEARKTDPLRTERPTVNLTFGSGSVSPSEGQERRRIRYRLVRLLDAPDEVRAGEIGILDQGDEVQLLERSGAYWLVLCPDGRRGWLHRMVLGEVVEDGAAVARVAGTPTASGNQGPGASLLDEILARRPRVHTDRDR